MDALLNGLSIDRQFSSVVAFVESLGEYTIPGLEYMEEIGKAKLFKCSNIYELQPTVDEYTFGDLLKMKLNTTITKMKTQLVRLMDDPYFAEAITNPSFDYYRIANENEMMLISLEHEHYKKEHLQIQYNGQVIDIRNAYNRRQIKNHYQDLSIVEDWRPNTRIVDNKYTFEIRFNEDNHMTPHFHVRFNEFTSSYKLPDFTLLVGNIPAKENAEIIEWALRHKMDIIELWNNIHGERSFCKLL